MKNHKRLIVITLLGFLWGCQSIKVSQDYNPARDFYSLETYAWQMETQPETGDIRVDNPLLHDRIRAAVNQSLLDKGYRKISEGKPDFYVSYKYGTHSRIESDGVGFGLGFGWGGRSRFGGIGVGTGSPAREQDERVLAVDLKDEQGNLLWRGVGTAPFEQHAGPEEITKEINAMVEKILSQFPP
ncbi:MAG: DUF4136 domain-containing protein [Desulfurivibrionaceae bacterium]